MPPHHRKLPATSAQHLISLCCPRSYGSLYRQGQTYLQLLPKMPQAETDALLLRFRRLLDEHATVHKLFALL